MDRSKWTYCLWVCMCVAWLCCGCTEKEELSELSVDEPKKLIVTLRIDADALRGGSRVDGNYGATSDEEAVNSLTLFYSTVANGVETVEGHQSVQKPNLSQLLRFELPATKGVRRFYLAANMSDAQIQAFTGDKSVYSLPSADLSKVYSNANQLMDIDPATGKGSNIVMTARITKYGNQDIAVDAGEISIDTPVKLDRVVSKVLLTCVESTSEGTGYVQVKNDIGWTKLTDVRYMANMFNRKLYLFPQVDAEGNPMDANYEMGALIERDATGNYVVRSDKYADYMDNFQFYDLYQQIDKLKASDATSKPYHKAVKYDASRLDPTSKNLYTEGMYFTENRVKNDLSFQAMGDYSLEETIAMTSRMVSTHLLVAARFVPKTVTYDDAGALKEVTVATEEEMLTTYLKACSETLVGETKNYPVGTFWYYNQKYYTMEGMKEFLKVQQGLGKDVQRADMERFDGGWGYYYTFIDGSANKGVIDHQGQTSWGLMRNHYYLLNVKNLIPPGSSVPGNKLMSIPTEKLEWIDRGESDVTVIP